MSFTADIKRELCECDLSHKSEKIVLYGFLYCLKDRKKYFTESPEISLFLQHISGEKAFAESCTFRGRNGFLLNFEKVPVKADDPVVNTAYVDGSDKNTGLFLRGVFLACGVVSDPNKDYHLELAVGNSEKSQSLCRLINESGMRIKSSTRKGKSILYAKESEAISDILTFIGAMISSMEIMNAKIYKGVRNDVNRAVNCESANIEKTVAASRRQQDDIEYIEKNGGIGKLPDELQALAVLRREKIELPLSEIGKMLVPPISRSGVYHRLKRISEFADKLRNKRGE